VRETLTGFLNQCTSALIVVYEGDSAITAKIAWAWFPVFGKAHRILVEMTSTVRSENSMHL
jgi:hypothetical protein